ncbi:hypothetical protein E2C01_028234 [Portunus trituberculatus]|uniref:Uncharacterized protein n=1 Tax=Portunus trituberculatus TaxID=210409 RepID=A0A5B7EK41_PORTR|nr:hypothetical protein [Portunus trituberculatus]
MKENTIHHVRSLGHDLHERPRKGALKSSDAKNKPDNQTFSEPGRSALAHIGIRRKLYQSGKFIVLTRRNFVR